MTNDIPAARATLNSSGISSTMPTWKNTGIPQM